MPENCPLTNCKFHENGGCKNEQIRRINNSIEVFREGGSDCVECFEPKC